MKRLPPFKAIATLLALGNLACATIHAQRAETRPVVVTASQLLREHWNAPTGSDEQFRGNTALIGVLFRSLEVPGKGTALELETDERGYFVRCRLTAEAAAAVSSPLLKGQLVALRGVGAGMSKDAPQLTACAVTWSGDRPESRPLEAARNATVTAASANLCALEVSARALSDIKFDPMPPYLSKKKEEIAREKQWNRDLLSKAGGITLACDHPLVALVSHCRWLKFGLGLGSVPIVEGNRYFESERVPRLPPECAAAQVTDALEQLNSDQFNPHPDPLPKGEGDAP